MLSATGHATTASVHFPRTQIEVDSIEVDSIEVDSIDVDSIEVDSIEVDSIDVDSIGVDLIKVDSIEMDSIEMGIRCCMLLDRPKHSINSQPLSERTGAVCVCVGP